MSAGASKLMQVTSPGGSVPSTSDAVVMNVTVTGGTANSFLTLYPAGGVVPNVSNLNFGAGQTLANLVVAKVGTEGRVALVTEAGSVDVIADVVGYFDQSRGDLFFPLTPTRLLDSRGAIGGWGTQLTAGAPKDLEVSPASVPINATAVIANTTVTGATADSFLTVYPSGDPVPNASNINYAVGQTVPNLVAVKIGAGGKVGFNSAVGATDVIFDIVGYFASISGEMSLRVRGNQLIDAQGKPVRLLGVNRDGSESMCTQPDGSIFGTGIFDGPDDDASIAAIRAWRTNAVRVPLNEDCWLGINGANPRYSGSAYISAIQAYVSRLHRHGLYAILDLHLNAPGSILSTSQQPGPDADHAPAFWASVATTFRDDRAVVFDLYNEPIQDSGIAPGADAWACWRDGCNAVVLMSNDSLPGTPMTWRMAGMQQLVDTVRATGATQPIMLGGISWAGDLTGWLSHVPSDPANQLIAAVHLYNDSSCATPACWDQNIGLVAQRYPVVTGELGEYRCSHEFVDTYMTWADQNGVSYLAWQWGHLSDPDVTCRSTMLVSDYSGIPTPYGIGLRDHLLKVGYP